MPIESGRGNIHESVFIANGASVIGDVTMGRDSSVWFNAVVRGDMKPIVIGEEVNIQDCAVVHTDDRYGTNIGNGVTVGHGAIVHAATIGNNVLVGMGSIILSGAVVGDNCIIGAGALVRQGMEVPPNSLVVGLPGKIIGEVNEETRKTIRSFVDDYLRLAELHKSGAVRKPQRG
ncbi:MAG: gamma carbonic anhydrase family protein [Planctomycetota bacterium]|nr:MAG: gamma carbonic anhydrase family protein [Planctomycetota bacterium]